MEFSDAELDVMWNALAQYVENRDDEVDAVEEAALSALSKLDLRKASLAGAEVVGEARHHRGE